MHKMVLFCRYYIKVFKKMKKISCICLKVMLYSIGNKKFDFRLFNTPSINIYRFDNTKKES